MTKLPYTNSRCNPVQAQQRIRSILQKFGVDRIIFDEDFKNFTVYVKFQYKGYPVSIPLNYAEMSKVYQKASPYTNRMRKPKSEWEESHRETAYKAAFSILEDFIKSMVTMVNLNVFSFEEIFVSYFVGTGGKRLGELFKEKLPELIGGRLALTEGKE